MIIYYLKALAGLRKLTDRSPEKRLEPLQEHLTFPALIYLRFCQGHCLSCKLIWIANNQEANAGGELHHLCAGLCLLSLLKNTIDRFLCGERPAKVYSPSFQLIYLSALLVLSSCLLLVGRKDVVASEGLILAVIKTASSIIRVKAQENLNLPTMLSPGCHQCCAGLHFLHLAARGLPPGFPLLAMGGDSPGSRSTNCFSPPSPPTSESSPLPFASVTSCLFTAGGAEQTCQSHSGCFSPPGKNRNTNAGTSNHSPARLL